MSKSKLFIYAVLHHQKEEIGDNKEKINTKLITDEGLQTILAKSEKEAGYRIFRELPESLADDFENIEIIIQSFH